MDEDRINETWLSVAKVGEKVGIPVETIRRYIRSHGVHLKVKKVHKRYLVHDDSMNVFKQIRELYAEGKNLEEVEQALSNRGVSMMITVESVDDKPMTVNVADELKRMNDTLEQRFREQDQFNKLLVDKLEQQQKYIDKKLEKRDHRLLETIRSMQEEKKARLKAQEEVATTISEKKWWKFWK